MKSSEQIDDGYYELTKLTQAEYRYLIGVLAGLRMGRDAYENGPNSEQETEQ